MKHVDVIAEYERDQRMMARQAYRTEAAKRTLKNTDTKYLEDVAFGRAPAPIRGGLTFWAIEQAWGLWAINGICYVIFFVLLTTSDIDNKSLAVFLGVNAVVTVIAAIYTAFVMLRNVAQR